MMVSKVNHTHKLWIILLLAILGIVTYACSDQNNSLPLPPDTLANTAIMEQSDPQLTSTPRDNPTITPTVTITPMQTQTESVTNSPTVEPDKTINLTEYIFRIGYVGDHDGQSLPNRQYIKGIYVLDPPYDSPVLIYEFDPEINYSSTNIQLSHDGSKIAFLKNFHHQPVLSIVDVESGDETEFNLELPASAQPATYLFWSLDDTFVAFSYTLPDFGNRISTVSVNLQDRTIWYAPDYQEFVAWSTNKTDEYLFIQHNYGETIAGGSIPDNRYVSVGIINQDTPVSSVTNLGEFAPNHYWEIVWSPDEDLAISVWSDISEMILIKLDFRSDTWEQIVSYPRYSVRVVPYDWSPDGVWMVGFRPPELYFFNPDDLENPNPISIPSKTDYVVPMGWTKDAQFYLFRDGQYLTAVNPDQSPLDPIILLNLAKFMDPNNHYSLAILEQSK